MPHAYRETAAEFAIDLEGLEQAIASHTRLLILNDPHNPSGAECSPEQIERIAELVIEHDLRVLCDEACFDVRLDGGRSRSLASLPGLQERCVILYTFSKRYAMGGWRRGATIGPKDIIDVIIMLNTNIESCTNNFVQGTGVEALTGDQSCARRILEVLRERRDVGAPILASTEGVTCHRPDATLHLYPNITSAMRGAVHWLRDVPAHGTQGDGSLHVHSRDVQRSSAGGRAALPASLPLEDRQRADRGRAHAPDDLSRKPQF